MKIITIIGARPQFIKSSVVSKAFQIEGIDEIIVHTGQHYDKNMSDVFFTEMNLIRPKYNLNINTRGHGSMTGRMIEQIEELLINEKPSAVLVYGDTNSTLAGAIAASKLNIKLIHVEAGLRSRNMEMPEEVNRILTDRISDLLFCPTEYAIANLKEEGFDRFDCKVIKSGDVMEDVSLQNMEIAVKNSTILKDLSLSDNDFYLSTIHRAENTDNKGKLQEIVKALNILGEKHPIILPIHPRTAKKIEAFGLRFEKNVRVIEPVGYLDMLRLLMACRMVFTDSGGLQKEAYFQSKFCITLRDETEWLELVHGGFNSIVGHNKEKIIAAAHRFESKEFQKKGSLYGNGLAAEKIKDSIVKYL